MNECKPLCLGHVESHEGTPARVKVRMDGRGLRLSTLWLNLSAFCGIGGAFRGCLSGVQGVSGGMVGCVLCQKRLRSS